MKKIIFILILQSLTFIPLFSNENLLIKWEDGKIYAYVFIKVKNDYNFADNALIGANSARNRAKAYFYEALKKINIYESISVLDYFEDKVEKNRELYSIIDKAGLYKIEYPDVNTIKFSYFIDIYGENSLMGIIMSERDIFTESLKSYMGFHYETDYTGIVIDARGELISYEGYKVKVKPALFVTIKDAEGRIVFNQNNVYPEVIRNTGMVRYSYDIGEDRSQSIGDKPLKIVASGTGDRTGSVIVITVSDAKRMLSSEITRNAIQNGKVVIIIDP